MSQSRYQIIEPDEEETPKSSRYQIIEEPEGDLKRTASALGDWFTGLPGRAGNAIVNSLNAAPSEIGGAISNPGRTVQNVKAAVGSNLLNTAASASPFPSLHQDFSPVANAAMGVGVQKPGDALVQGAVNVASIAGVGVGAAKELLGMNKVKRVGAELTRAEKAEGLAKSAHEAAQAQEEAAKDEAQKVGIPQTAEGIESNINKKESALHDANMHVNALNHELEAAPTASTGEPTEARQEAEHHLNAANEMVRSSQMATENADKQITDYLQPLAAHDVEAAAKIKATHEANKKQLNKGYDELENSFAQKDVKVNHEEAIKNKTGELMDFIKNNEARSPEATKLIGELEDLKAGKSGNAKDYLHAYRSVKQYAREARAKAYERGMNQEERNEWKAKTKELDEQVDQMGKTLEESVGGEDYETLKKLNSRWRNEVVPMEQNTTYRRIHKSGTMPKNIAESIRGTEPGNVLMQNIIKNNPDIARNVVGQQAKNVLNPNANLKPYRDVLPDLNRMIDYRGKVNESLENAKATLEKAQTNHKLASEAEAAETTRLGKADKEQEALRAEMGKHYDTINKLQKELETHRLHLEKLKDARNAKNQTLAQREAAEKQYKIAKEKYDNTHSLLKKMTSLVKKIVASKYGGLAIGGAAFGLGLEGIKSLTSGEANP